MFPNWIWCFCLSPTYLICSWNDQKCNVKDRFLFLNRKLPSLERRRIANSLYNLMSNIFKFVIKLVLDDLISRVIFVFKLSEPKSACSDQVRFFRIDAFRRLFLSKTYSWNFWTWCLSLNQLQLRCTIADNFRHVIMQWYRSAKSDIWSSYSKPSSTALLY